MQCSSLKDMAMVSKNGDGYPVLLINCGRVCKLHIEHILKSYIQNTKLRENIKHKHHHNYMIKLR